MNPSNSSMATLGIGVPAATVLAWLTHVLFGVEVPGPVEAAGGALIAGLIGLFFKGGLREHTE